MTLQHDRADIAIIGTGAAGLFAAIWAGRTAQESSTPLRVVAFDGARRLGAKILVAGGGRCNVTHHQVSERDFAGSTPPAIRNVLRQFDVARTTLFFSELGVELKREETGKLFPVTDDAHTVLDALLTAARRAQCVLRHPARVDGVVPSGGRFEVTGAWGTLLATRVILCMGGKALPKSGSDGEGFKVALALGHSIAPPVVPALVPLLLPKENWLLQLSGLSLEAELTLCASTGKRLARTRGSTLCTHFGLSGPAVLDISRHYLVEQSRHPGVRLTANWCPGLNFDQFDRELVEAKGVSALTVLRRHTPERMARAICQVAGVEPNATTQQLARERRRELSALVTECPLPVTGDRGFTFAEATAGGVPLSEIRLDTMESRIVPGLHLAGEICDVDGRIGGFNFQWAWASGFVAGCAAAKACTQGAQRHAR